jgi:hypothetical protein
MELGNLYKGIPSCSGPEAKKGGSAQILGVSSAKFRLAYDFFGCPRGGRHYC